MRLTEDDLVDIAKSNGQDHLLAISNRASLTEPVTSVLVERGAQQVAHAVAKNSGARFSKAGFVTLAKRAEADAELAEHLVLRRDIPLHVFDKLLSSATDIVRGRLLASASPENQDKILRALAVIADESADVPASGLHGRGEHGARAQSGRQVE